MRAVSDAGPLIHLSWIDQLSLLTLLFEEVVIPPAVHVEVLSAPPGTLGLENIQRALQEETVKVIEAAGGSPSAVGSGPGLDKGEAEAIRLAQDIKADILLSDDSLARREAGARGLLVIGTVGILTEARDNRHIESALPFLVELRRLGQWISDPLLELVRREEAGQ